MELRLIDADLTLIHEVDDLGQVVVLNAFQVNQRVFVSIATQEAVEERGTGGQNDLKYESRD